MEIVIEMMNDFVTILSKSVCQGFCLLYRLANISGARRTRLLRAAVSRAADVRGASGIGATMATARTVRSHDSRRD